MNIKCFYFIFIRNGSYRVTLIIGNDHHKKTKKNINLLARQKKTIKKVITYVETFLDEPK